MFNFRVRVRALDAMSAQLRAMGEGATGDPAAYPNGRIARLHDPEGDASNSGSQLGLIARARRCKTDCCQCRSKLKKSKTSP